jgi:hypothetical protein
VSALGRREGGRPARGGGRLGGGPALAALLCFGAGGCDLDVLGYRAQPRQRVLPPDAGAALDLAVAPDLAVPLAKVTAIASGFFHTCALLDDGTLRCWGANDGSQLGRSGGSSQFPIPLPLLTDVVQVATGLAHTCARQAAGNILCWGLDLDGELGDNMNVTRLAPFAVPGLRGVIDLRLGADNCFVQFADGSARSWGENDCGELGSGDAQSRGSPHPMVAAGFASLAPSDCFTCAAMVDGSASCWGRNGELQLGRGDPGFWPFPNRVAGVSEVSQVATGRQHACLLVPIIAR